MFGKGSTLLAEIDAEVMVGSLQHLYAGRYDMRCRWTGGPMVTRTYPKRANKVEELPAGRYMLDLKTSSGVYQSHALQLAAYEGASVECGYEPTDYQAVIQRHEDGRVRVRSDHRDIGGFLERPSDVRSSATEDDMSTVKHPDTNSDSIRC